MQTEIRIRKSDVARRTRQRALVALAAGVVVMTASGPSRSAPPSQNFDHLRTGFELNGAHRRAPCESCHVGGSFQSTPNQCGLCHTGSGAGGEGKSQNHVQSSNRCDDCHSTVAWTPVRFDHAGVRGSCSSCHNGRRASGKSRNHIQSGNNCDDCHGTRSFASARFDHDNVSGSCGTCHNGSTATGKSRNHIQSGNSCDDCHSTAAWTPARFDHASVTGSCSSCHNGSTATGKSGNHFGTSQQCDTCHSANAWTPTSFRHSSPDYPGDHRANLSCKSCHKSNSQTVTWSNSAYKPDCAGCHARDYKQGPHKKVKSPVVYYSVSELRDCTGSCHQYSDTTMQTISKRRNSKHRVSSGGF